MKNVFGKARPPVQVTIGRYRYASTISVYGGKSYIPVRRSHREAAGVAVGDLVDVTIELDTAPRTVEPPPELAAALVKSPRARARWDELSFTHQREHADAVIAAKRPATRVRRVEKTIEMLLATPARVKR